MPLGIFIVIITPYTVLFSLFFFLDYFVVLKKLSLSKPRGQNFAVLAAVQFAHIVFSFYKYEVQALDFIKYSQNIFSKNTKKKTPSGCNPEPRTLLIYYVLRIYV
jgi:hypothetical protein